MKRTPMWMVALLAFLLAGAGFSNEASAQTQGWAAGDTGQAMAMNELIPRMSSGQAYTERYSFSANLDGGGHIGINFTISNLGIRNGFGAAEVRVRLPGQDYYNFSDRVSRRQWEHTTDRFSLNIAQTRVEADGNNAFVLRHQGDVELELRFENRIPMWRPGNGEVRRGEDYYRFGLIAPRADVTGRVKINGTWHEVKGSRSGYADHVVTNVAPYDLARRFTRFRTYDDDLFVMWREIELTEDYGGQKISWVIVGIGDAIVFEDTAPQVNFSNLHHDSETGYHVPHAAEVISGSGNRQLRFSLQGNNVERRDLLESYGRVARAIASRLSNPFQYNVNGDYSLDLNLGSRQVQRNGSSHITVDFVNP